MSLCYNNAVRYEYQYTSDGKLHSVVDNASGVGYLYEYDSEDRLSNYTEYKLDGKTNSLSINYSYNEKNQLELATTSIDYVYGSDKKTLYWFESYYYDDYNDGNHSFDTGNNTGLLKRLELSSNIISGSSRPSDITIDYSHDGVQRLTNKLFTVSGSNSFTNQVEYVYNDRGRRLSSQISQYSTQINSETATTYTYTYDSNGNITKIVDNEGKITNYEYDDLGQLTREDNPYVRDGAGATYYYTYDNNGNRLTQKACNYGTEVLIQTMSTYLYEDSTWGDRLTSYRGNSITYDTIGNPLSYYNGSFYNFTWSDGRRLTSATKGSNSFSFTYNDEGIRTSKTVDGVKHTYVLNGSQIVSEQWGNY